MYVVHAKTKLNFLPGTIQESDHAYKHLRSDPLPEAEAKRLLQQWKEAVEAPWEFWIEPVDS